MAILDFQKPDKVIMLNSDDFHGEFEFRPLEPGYGITIGNSLRRILLSSLEGFAISSIKIHGADHEFTTLKGVVEDVTEIVLNLKQVRFKRQIEGTDSETVIISVSGQQQLTAGDLGKFTSAFQVLNPELVICNMESSVKFEMELTIVKGRGYVPAEENKTANAAFGTIFIDSIFTPIVNVQYTIENLIHHFMLFSDERITLDSEIKAESEEFDETSLHMRQLLKTKLVDMDLSVRALNCLKAADVETLGDLVSYAKSDLLKFRNFGKKSLTELEDLVDSKGLTFGMNVAKYKLDRD
jgi:DNA-directed RNA polymerase subunit alpha